MRKNNPHLSVIIPVLNEEKYLPTLLTDLSRQSHRDFEVIVVDGHSTDTTVQKAKHFEHRLPQLTIINSEVRHVCHQRNLGASVATGDLLIFMDADNQIPNHLLSGLTYRHAQTDTDFFTTYINSNKPNIGDQAIDTVINLYLEITSKTKSPFVLESMFGVKRDKFNKLKGFKVQTPNEGPELLKRAQSKKMTYSVFRDPNYAYSMRRVIKRGTLESLSATAIIQLSTLLGITLDQSKADRLYPMEGGSAYEIDTHKQDNFNRFLQKLKLKKHSDKLIDIARSILFETDSKRK